MSSKYEKIELSGVPGLFSNGRLLDEDIPTGLYRYDLRGSDSDPGDPIAVEKNVFVNHAASVVLSKKLNLGKEQRLMLEEDEGLNFTGDVMTLEEFKARYV